ncbi:MAG: SixA phosphatase family protein [Alphaproteobacteria bacterium]
MKILALLRHGKSSRDDATLRDFDRPLKRRGRLASELVGKELRRRGIEFDLVAASPARRVVETVELLQKGFGEPLKVQFINDIYGQSSEGLMEILRNLGDKSGRILLVGHNPGLQDLALALAEDTDPLRIAVAEHYPTATLALLELPLASWSRLRPETGRIADFLKPRDIGKTGEQPK